MPRTCLSPWRRSVDAVRADPAFGLALADLEAYTEAPPTSTGGRLMSWERHHIEVVRTAAAGEVTRATDLLRDHLASVGCDPLALRIVTDLRRRAGNRYGLQDLSAQSPDCHRSSGGPLHDPSGGGHPPVSNS